MTAEILVENLRDRSTYIDQVTFQVLIAPHYTYQSWIDGREIDPSQSHVSRQGYHRLRVIRTHEATGQEEERIYRYVVQDAIRGGSEWGLSPWTPHPWIASAAAEFEGADLQLVYPPRLPAGLPLPLIAWVRNNDGTTRRVNGRLVLGGTDQTITLRRGVGSAWIPASLTQSGQQGTAIIHGQAAPWSVIREKTTPWTTAPGQINTDTQWPSDSRIQIHSDLRLSAGATLRIGAGSVIVLGPDVNLIIDGRLEVTGLPESPVLFSPMPGQAAWGGCILPRPTSTLRFEHAILTGSGADRSWFRTHRDSPSHRPEQATFFLGSGSQAEFHHTYWIDHQGQALNGKNASVELDHVLIQRCQTVGQFNGGSVKISHSALLEFPVDDPSFVDGDNDAIYFTTGTHHIRDTLVGWTKDDGIDAGADSPGEVTVERCWFESCFHEGMALSGVNKRVTISDSVFLNNGQGVEAGYLSPQVQVRDSLLTGNLVGLRFGDNYFRQHQGRLQSTGSLSIFNHRDVWGLTATLWEEDFDHLFIHQNHLSEGLDRHPDNRQWLTQPEDALRLRAFQTHPDQQVGIGFLEKERTPSFNEAQVNIPVGLSLFSSQLVDAHVEVVSQTPGAEARYDLPRKQVSFSPGQTVAVFPIHLPQSGIAWTAGEVQLRITPHRSAEAVASHREFTLRLPGLTQLTPLFSEESPWRLRSGSEAPSQPATAWHHPDFNDEDWRPATTPIGHGREDLATRLPDMPDQSPSISLRRILHLERLASVDALLMRTRIQGGFILWFNGYELVRRGMEGDPHTFVPHTATAIQTDSQETIEIPVESIPSIHSGDNLVAVQAFAPDLDSAPFSFDLDCYSRSPLDLDADRLPDQWETRIINSNPHDALVDLLSIVPEADPDHDGQSNRSEFLSGTNPLDPSSAFRIEWLHSDAPNVQTLSFQQEPRRRYQLDRADTPAGPWSPIRQFEPINRSSLQTTEVRQPQSQAYYRLRVEF